MAFTSQEVSGPSRKVDLRDPSRTEGILTAEPSESRRPLASLRVDVHDSLDPVARRRPPKTPAREVDPVTGATLYTSRALAAIAGVNPRTLLTWVSTGILPPVRFRGPRTRYGEEHARIVRAIAKVGWGFARHPRLAELLPIILNEPAARPAPSGAVASSAAGRTAGEAGAPPVPPRVRDDGAPTPPRASARSAVSRAKLADASAWTRLVLLDGLELHVRDDLPPALLRLVGDVAAQFGSSPSMPDAADPAER